MWSFTGLMPPDPEKHAHEIPVKNQRICKIHTSNREDDLSLGRSCLGNS